MKDPQKTTMPEVEGPVVTEGPTTTNGGSLL